MNLGQKIDKAYELKQQLATIVASEAPIKEELNQLKSEIHTELKEQGTLGTSGTTAKVSIGTQLVGQVLDWDKVYNYISENEFWELLQKRLSNAALKELIDSGVEVPGIKPITLEKLNLKKV